MAKNLTEADTFANTGVDAKLALANGGLLRIYDGSQPATADTAIGAQVMLAELTFGSPAFGAAADGVATANAITADASANATGTAAWFRVFASNGTTALFDGTVGAGGTFDIVLATTSIVAAASVSVTAFTYTHPQVP